MSYTNERWATSYCVQQMYLESTVDKTRAEYVKDQKLTSNEEINMPYMYTPKLNPVFPVWWPGAKSNNDEHRLMYRHFLDPSPRQLSPLFRSMITSVHMPQFNGTIDSQGSITSNYSIRSKRQLRGMPILNSASVGSPVTKLHAPALDLALQKECKDWHGSYLTYSYEERFLEPLVPLIVHYYYEVVHGPEYIEKKKGNRFCDTLLCLGNLKTYCKAGKPAIDKIAMHYMFGDRSLPPVLDDVIHECPLDCFNHNEEIYQDKWMFSPLDVGSVTRFFCNVSVLVNVTTSGEIHNSRRDPKKPYFATKVAALFEALEDKTSSSHKDNIKLYGTSLSHCVPS